MRRPVRIQGKEYARVSMEEMGWVDKANKFFLGSVEDVFLVATTVI